MIQFFLTVVFISAFLIDFAPKVQKKQKKEAILSGCLLLVGYAIAILESCNIKQANPMLLFNTFLHWISHV